MATTTATKAKRDKLPAAELEKFLQTDTVLEAGRPFLWLMDFGWAKIGFYVKHLAPNRILVAHCNHFRSAGKDYGRLAMEGAESNCEWRYEGVLVEINTAHILQTSPYNGTVNRSPIILSE
jgi:hypothetical protein